LSRRPDDWPPYDRALAESYVGKYILVGITYLDPEGKVTQQIQMHGTIVSVDERKGIEIELGGMRAGQTYTMPPDLSSISRANPGEYRLHSSGERIVDPDLLSTWTVHKPVS
jgi:hypothetical protein